MSSHILAVVVTAATLLAGCQISTPEFGGSGGSSGSGGSGGSGGGNQAGLSLARDVCRNELQARGKQIVRIASATQNANSARVVVVTRRDPLTVSTERWECMFYYGSGRTSISRL